MKGSEQPSWCSTLAPRLLKCLQLGSLRVGEGLLTGGAPASSCHFWEGWLPCAHINGVRIQGQVSLGAGYTAEVAAASVLLSAFSFMSFLTPRTIPVRQAGLEPFDRGGNTSSR